MIVSGRITQEAVIEADSAAQAWALAHPPKSDPALLAGLGKPVGWVELVPIKDEAAA